MPTAPDADVVPVKKATKLRLDELRAGRTYDATIRDLLDGRAAPLPGTPSKTRHPDEQIALAELAARRWTMAVAAGRIMEAGPRLVIWNIPKREKRDAHRYTWLEGRGLPP